MPFAIAAIAAIARSAGSPVASRVVLLVVAATAVASLSIAWVPGVWIAVGLLVAAVAVGRAGVTAIEPAAAPDADTTGVPA
jgi:hypothetical protein